MFNAYTAKRSGDTLEVYFHLTRNASVKMVMGPSPITDDLRVSLTRISSVKANSASLSFIERMLVKSALDLVAGLPDNALPLSFEMSMRYSNVAARRIFRSEKSE